MKEALLKIYQPDNSLRQGYISVFKELVRDVIDNRWLTWQLFKRDFFAMHKQDRQSRGKLGQHLQACPAWNDRSFPAGDHREGAKFPNAVGHRANERQQVHHSPPDKHTADLAQHEHEIRPALEPPVGRDVLPEPARMIGRVVRLAHQRPLGMKYDFNESTAALNL